MLQRKADLSPQLSRHRPHHLLKSRPMEIQVNGEKRAFDQAPSVLDLLNSMQLGDRRVAVEVNREIVPKSEHASHLLANGDEVEIVHAIGGG